MILKLISLIRIIEILSELLDNFKFFAQVAAVAISDVNLNTTGR